MAGENESAGLDASFDTAPQQQEQTTELTPEETLGAQFLNNIPEQDRPIVAKYVKDWDGNVTKKFQSIHEQYKPYKELGEVDQLKAAHTFYTNFRSNGEQIFYDMLKGYLQHYGADAPNKLMEAIGVSMDQFNQQPPQDGEWDYSQGEPDPNEVFQQNVMSELEELRQFKEQWEQSQQEAELNKQLDMILDNMHTQYPHIPQDYLVQGIAAGASPQKIVESYDNLVKSVSSQQNARPNPPVVMGAGQGGVPSGQVDVSKLDRKGRVSAVEQFLAAQQE